MNERKRLWVWGEMVGGRLDLDRRHFAELLQQMPDGPVKVSVAHEKLHDEIRQMQKFWHAVPVEICRKDPMIGGLQHDAMHYALLGEWRGYMDGPLGHQVPICSSSRKLTKAEWVELIDWVLVWGPSEHGIVIPEPTTDRAKQMTEDYHAATRD